MVDLEYMLIIRISHRLEKLRETGHGKIPPDIIANGQKSAILRMEKGKRPKSGNFISDTLLDSYADYFKKSKTELIFGTEKNWETDLMLVFFEVFSNITPKRFSKQFTLAKIARNLPSEVREAILNLAYCFADFGRWYDLKREHETKDEKETIDFLSMFQIIWRLCKRKILRSFKEKVVFSIFNEADDKFYFNRINTKFNQWLQTDFTNIIVPEMVEKLKNDSIFKMGYIVKNLIDESLVRNLPPAYLKEIPLEEFFPPVKSYLFHWEEGNKTDENLKKFAEESFRMMNQKMKNLTIEDYEKMSEENFFEGVSGVTDNSTPFVNGTRIVGAEKFIDYVINMPAFFDKLHDLNRTERKIPGILTVNSHASNLFQIKVNEVFEGIINDLVRYQNIFINCIKWEELEDFAK